MSETAIIVLWSTVGIAFGIMLVGLLASAVALRAYRRERRTRLEGLRIHRMLARVGIPIPRYLRASDPLTVEKQLWICEHCGTTRACDEYLECGNDEDAHGFCPNYAAFRRLKDGG